MFTHRGYQRYIVTAVSLHDTLRPHYLSMEDNEDIYFSISTQYPKAIPTAGFVGVSCILNTVTHGDVVEN